MTTLRMTRELFNELQRDLRRMHPFASERVAFVQVHEGNRGGEHPLVLASASHSVTDDDYINDPLSGARINGTAIRAAMQRILDSGAGILHVHLHEHDDAPSFGRMDRREIPRLVKSFVATDARVPHGMLVLSNDSAHAWVAMPGQALRPVDKVVIVGRPMTIIGTNPAYRSARYDRQSFLGRHSQRAFESTRVGIAGLGGGGSHMAQQLAHLGFKDYVLFDKQRIEDSNLNRLVGGTENDVAGQAFKVDIAHRVICGIRSDAQVLPIRERWQDAAGALRSCDLVFGCVDGFDERRQLERSCRRYLIPLIDIGMDVQCVKGQLPRMAGQVILSTPGEPCMQCIGFLNEKTLTREAQRYGDAGDNPQVVWANGVLASTAIGIAVDLLTGWTGKHVGLEYLSYDGNRNCIGPHVRLEYLPKEQCTHHPLDQVGDPV
jgi:hypothetical protein